MLLSPKKRSGENPSTNRTKAPKQALILFNIQKDHLDNVLFPGEQLNEDFLGHLDFLLKLDFDVKIWVKTLHPINHHLIAQNIPGSKENSYAYISKHGETIVWEEHCMEGTSGSKWSDRFYPAPDDYVVTTSYGPESPSPDTPSAELLSCLRENDIDQIFCAGFAIDHFINHGALNFRQVMPRLDMFVVMDLAKSLHTAVSPSVTLGTQLKWSFLKKCRSHEVFQMFGAQSNTIQKIGNKNNCDMDREDRRRKIFNFLKSRKNKPSTKFPSMKVLEDLGFMDHNIVNEVDKRCGKSIFHTACELGDVEVVKVLLGTNTGTDCKTIRPSAIRVNLKSASNLPNADMFGTSDPYAVLMLGERGSDFDWVGTKVKAHRSTRVDNQLNPVWDETFVLIASGLRQPVLKVSVFDHDIYGADDLLGEVCIEIDKPTSPTNSYILKSSNDQSTLSLAWQTIYAVLESENGGISGDANSSVLNAPGIIKQRASCVDCTVLSTHGHTPVTLAAKESCPDVLLAILRSSQSHGIDLEHRVNGEGGRTALMYAAISGNVRTVKLLLMFGANPKTKNHYGQSAIHFACYGKNEFSVDVIQSLLNAIPDRDHRLAYLSDDDDCGWNAWHIMSRSGLLGKIDWRNSLENLRLSKGVSATTTSGLTILHIAAWNSSYDTIKLLLEGLDKNNRKLFPVVQSNYLTPSKFSELDLAIVRYLENAMDHSTSLVCCAALAHHGYHAMQMAGTPCQKLLYRLVLDWDVRAVEGLLRFDENKITLNLGLIQTITKARYVNKCTFTFTQRKYASSQIMYYSKSRRVNICMVCRDRCCKVNDAENLIDIGVLENQVCQCHLNGLCQSLNVQGDTHLTKLAYVPKPIVIRRSQLSRIRKNRRPLVTLLAESFHKTTCEELKAHGWSYGEKKDLVKMTDPLVADFTQLTRDSKQMYMGKGAYILSLIQIAGYNIVGPLSAEQLATRRSDTELYDSYSSTIKVPTVLSALIVFIAKDRHEIEAHHKYLDGYRYAPMWIINSRHNELLDNTLVPFELLGAASRQEALKAAAGHIALLLANGYVIFETEKHAMDKIRQQYEDEAGKRVKENYISSTVLDTTRQKMLNICLRAAARANQTNLLSYLLTHTNAAKNSRDKYHFTPLIYAIKRGSVEAVNVLLNAGANYKTRTKYGLTPLMLASCLNHIGLVNIFLRMSVDLLERDEFGMTALHHAVYRNNIPVIEQLASALRKQGFSVDLPLLSLQFMPATSSNLKSSIRSKLDSGMTKLKAADAFRHDTHRNNGATKQSNGQFSHHYFETIPHRGKLHQDKTNFVRVITHASAKDKIKNTSPLSIAVQRGNSRAVEVLLKYGANPINEQDGSTPYQNALENAGKDFEKLKVVRSNVEGFSTINSYMQQFWAYLLSLRKRLKTCYDSSQGQTNKRKHRRKRRKALVVGKSFVAYGDVVKNKSSLLHQKLVNEHRILNRRYEHSSKIVDILNTNRLVVKFRNRFAMKNVLPRFFLLLFAIICLTVGTNIGQLGKGLDNTLNIMRLEQDNCLITLDPSKQYNTNISKWDVYNSHWWSLHKSILLPKNVNRHRFPHSCIPENLFSYSSHIHLIGPVKIDITDLDYSLEKYTEIEHVGTSPSHILLFPMQPNVTSYRLSYIEENDILGASIRQVITTINIFNANTNMYAVIEVQRNFHETGLVELKLKTIPFEINLNKEKRFDIHYPSIGFGVAVFLFLIFYIASKSPVPTIKFIKNPAAALKSVSIAFNASVVVIFILAFLTIIVNSIACAELDNIENQIHKNKFVLFKNIVGQIRILHTLTSLTLFFVLMEMIHEVLKKFPVCGKWIKLVFRNIFDTILVLPYMLIFFLYLAILGAYFWIATSGNVDLYKATLLEATQSVIYVPFAEEFKRLYGSSFVIQPIILLSIFILNNNLIGLIGDRWKSQLETASKEWERMIDIDLQIAHSYKNPRSVVDERDVRKMLIKRRFQYVLLLLGEDGIRHHGDIRYQNEAGNVHHNVTMAQANMTKCAIGCIGKLLDISSRSAQLTAKLDAVLKQARSNLVRTRLRSAKARIGQLNLAFNDYKKKYKQHKNSKMPKQRIFVAPPRTKPPSRNLK